MEETKNFYSDKHLTRFEYLKRSLLIIASIAFVHALYTFKFTNRNISPVLEWTFDILVASGLLFWILTSEIVTQIQLDLTGKKFIVHYFTVFSKNKKSETPFEYLTSSFTKQPTKHQPKKWVLKIFDKKKQVFTIETGRDGFSQETLESLAEQLKQLSSSS